VDQEIVLPADEAPKKLENFLKKRFPIGYVRKLFRKNGVRLNGQRTKRDAVVGPGDRLELYIPFETQVQRATANGWELETVFEDAKLLVLNKPAGLSVHEGREILKRDTILGMLESRYRPQGVAPRLVHRLDKETSGLFIVAKDAEAAKELETRFQEATVDKEYVCLVAGRIPQSEGTIDLPLPGREGKAVRAVTRFRIAKRFSDTTLLRVNIATGRMHQIRLHFAKLGYPVVMDAQHGDFSFNKAFRKTYGLKRQFLHAAKIVLEYGGKNRTWLAPLPKDLKRCLASLEAISAGTKRN
jgi:23S rRNA pseudouridine955/2504/2580 synthase